MASSSCSSKQVQLHPTSTPPPPHLPPRTPTPPPLPRPPTPHQVTSGSKPSIHPMPLDLFDPFGLQKKMTPEKKQKVLR